jgi:hypothetical protein
VRTLESVLPVVVIQEEAEAATEAKESDNA